MGGWCSGRNQRKPGAGRKPGKKKDGRGRPVLQEKNREPPYSKLSREEKLLYHRQKARESKGYLPATLPPPPPAPSTHGTTTSETAPAIASEKERRGRPPLNSEDGAMDETALKERKKLLGRLKYKRDKISKLRKKALMQRIDRQDEAESGDETSDDEVDDHASGVGYDAGGDGELHPKTVKNKKSEFLALLPLHTGLQYELLKKLVVVYDCEQLSIDRGEDLDGGGDRMSLHRYRVKVCHFLDKFEAKYKQKLGACSFLLHWAQKLISQRQPSSELDFPSKIQMIFLFT